MLHIIFDEARGKLSTRQYFEAHGRVLPPQKKPVFEGYASCNVMLASDLPVPLPCNGFAQLILDDQKIHRTAYTTATQKDPFNKDAGRAYAGIKKCYTTGIALQPSIPTVHWIQLGNRGDKHIAQVKLKRVAEAHNIHSDEEGNLYVYTLEKVYLHVKV